MSFENGQTTFVHLVSFPSIWLPGPNVIKVLLLCNDYEQLDVLVDHCQEKWPEVSWTFYFVPKFDMSNQEQVDWILVNRHHVTGIYVEARDYNLLALAGILNDHNNLFLSYDSPDAIVRLAGNSNFKMANLEQTLTTLAANHSQQRETK